MTGRRSGPAEAMTGRRSGPAEAGSAGLAMVWVAAVVLAAAIAAVAWGAALVARHRAGRTADLAALAAAAQLQAGTPEPCRAAARVAATAAAEVEICSVLTDGSVQVVVRLSPRAPGPWNLVLPAARARARAGPEG